MTYDPQPELDADVLEEVIARVAELVPAANAVELHTADHTEGMGFQLVAIHIEKYELPIGWARDYLRPDLKELWEWSYGRLSCVAWYNVVGEGDLGEAVIEIESGVVVSKR